MRHKLIITLGAFVLVNITTRWNGLMAQSVTPTVRKAKYESLSATLQSSDPSLFACARACTEDAAGLCTAFLADPTTKQCSLIIDDDVQWVCDQFPLTACYGKTEMSMGVPTTTMAAAPAGTCGPITSMGLTGPVMYNTGTTCAGFTGGACGMVCWWVCTSDTYVQSLFPTVVSSYTFNSCDDSSGRAVVDFIAYCCN